MPYTGTPEEIADKRHRDYLNNRVKNLARRKAWRDKNLDKIKSYNDNHREDAKQKRREKRRWFVDYKKTLSCQRCPESDPVCLDFHHLDPKKKDNLVSTLVGQGKSPEVVKEEIKKCIVLCANCHRKEHHKPTDNL